MSNNLPRRSKKKTKRDLTAEAIKAFERNPNKPLNYKQVSKILKINDHTVKQLTKALLEQLQEQKIIEEVILLMQNMILRIQSQHLLILHFLHQMTNIFKFLEEKNISTTLLRI